MAHGFQKTVITEARYKQNGIDIVYPQVSLQDKKIQDKINQAIQDRVFRLIARQRQWPDSAGIKHFEMSGDYKITLDEENILSIRFENFIYPELAAHGLTMVDSITIDLKSGKEYTLADLFERGSDYIYVLNQFIAKQFKQQGIPMISEFKGITANQDYYLTKENMIIYFQIYEYTPYYVGVVEFKIPYYKITNYINENGPIGRISY